MYAFWIEPYKRFEGQVHETIMLSAVMRQSLRIFIWQCVAVGLAGGLAALNWGARLAGSVWIGGGIGVLATSYVLFAMIKARLQIGKPPSLVSVFVSWLVKSILILGLLMIAMRSRLLVPPALLAGLVCSLVAYWLSVVLVNYASGTHGK